MCSYLLCSLHKLPLIFLCRYQDILVCMMDSVVKKMLLHHNIDELREIDDDAVDDDVREGKCESN